MAQKSKAEEVIPAGQEDVKAVTTSNSVVDGGTLVRPKEDTVIFGTKGSLLGENVEHVVHRVLAEKLVAKGQAYQKDASGKRISEAKKPVQDEQLSEAD
jgi:hypothetical protein